MPEDALPLEPLERVRAAYKERQCLRAVVVGWMDEQMVDSGRLTAAGRCPDWPAYVAACSAFEAVIAEVCA